ncbi:MAG TPA: peptidylprolyl isomerase [Bacteroidales bacterium]|nr:peptidylprolyl isomerase [Bacteroidales bacterium]
MRKMIYRVFLLSVILIHTPGLLSSQEKLIDEVAGVVGSNVILFSDIETQYLQLKAQGNILGGSQLRCQILESLLFQKLLLNQAELDSVEISDSRVESAMDARLRYFINQFGSQEKLEEFYQKSVLEIKEEMRELVRDEMKISEVQNKITENLQITPSDVKEYFTSLPPDSIPLVDVEYEIGQVVKNPPITVEELSRTYDKIKALRDRIIKGDNFSTLAILYSEDPGSAGKGGELGMFNRGTMYPEFEAAAFNLNKPGEVSEIIKTEAGYHIIQLIERKGEYINVRHILIQPKVSPESMELARAKLDSVAQLILEDSLTFEEAVLRYSDDPNRISGGMIINPETNSTRFASDQLDPSLFFIVDQLDVGEISQPVRFLTDENKEAYRILYLKVRTEPHRANLLDDYDKLKNWARADKQDALINDWINEKIEGTYIKVNEKYAGCTFINNWIPSTQ